MNFLEARDKGALKRPVDTGQAISFGWNAPGNAPEAHGPGANEGQDEERAAEREPWRMARREHGKGRAPHQPAEGDEHERENQGPKGQDAAHSQEDGERHQGGYE